MFVVVEGSNGAGKTTLIKNLEAKGCTTLSSPNGTPLAKMLRPACRGVDPWEGIDKKVQFLLFSAARLDEYIYCVKDNKNIVVADRWWTSTYVYQCILQGIDVGFMEHTIHENEKIDLVIILDGDDEVLLSRMSSEREKNPGHGKCQWSKNDDTLRSLMKIYREDLPNYLGLKGVRCEMLNTSSKPIEEVVEEAYSLIQQVKEQA